MIKYRGLLWFVVVCWFAVVCRGLCPHKPLTHKLKKPTPLEVGL